MALAGLKRLRLAYRVTQVFEPDDLLSAPGQGAVAVQVRSDDDDARSACRRLDHLATRVTTAAERTLLATLEAGCHAPVGALARWDGAVMDLQALVARADGGAIERRIDRRPIVSEHESRAFGAAVAGEFLSSGAARLLVGRPPASAAGPGAAGRE
jgi:hydroxymethylbilane synthase